MTQWDSAQTKPVSPDITAKSNALPARYFTEDDVFEMENEKIFGQYWMYAGHANSIKDPGEFFTRTIGNRELLVVRANDGTVRAVKNVSARDGSAIVTDVPMTDPEHIDLDELDSADDVHVDSIGPLLFVNPRDDPMLLAEQAGVMKDRLEALPLEEYEHACRISSEVECNWKVFASNYSECDHCQANHQDWIKGISLDESELEVNDYHWVLHYTHEADIDDEVRIHDEREAQFHYLWPNFTINMYGTADGYGTYIIDPIDTDQFRLIADYYFRDSELTEDEREFVRTSRQLQEEDFELVERQWDGLKTGALAQAQLGPNEHTVHKFHQLAQEAYNS
ncbi:aromatic ring-hydroxylating oxygenase subunit alpha [Natronorubrum thiooxidans]|uniref:Phenylpropionate dioxygenase, large terminal subunit n=1 Tax=Natronorubrum thiooxidans TaxID=308853 RepID=A0A1N7GLP8_9EURY|nr:SRPBCC family protein [Natronorubrum thiooxidans]SIS13452.1 Phenylpropionate dioxygenase, large terminal subunit [Natronorubrum thiooxidans]